MTGIEWALLISSLASSAAGAAGGSGDDSRNGFRGAMDPNSFGMEIRDKLNGLFQQFQDQATKPVQLRSSYVQNLGHYNGGGLPMNIGFGEGWASDPALHDPSLLMGAPWGNQTPPGSNNVGPGPNFGGFGGGPTGGGGGSNPPPGGGSGGNGGSGGSGDPGLGGGYEPPEAPPLPMHSSSPFQTDYKQLQSILQMLQGAH